MTEHKTLAAALAAFQSEPPKVTKGSTASIPGRSQYHYADLADITDAVLPALAKHGLSWLTMPTYTDAGNFVLRYELLHTSGESRSGEYPLPQGKPQEIGSALTYGRRQTLCAVTGVAADEDDDGKAGGDAAPASHPRQAVTARSGSSLTAAQVHEQITNLAKARGVDRAVFAAEFEARTKKSLDGETDVKLLKGFVDAVNDGRVKLPEPAGT